MRDALTPLEGAALVEGRTIRSVGVAGSGTMASGIAEVFAKAGYEVVLAARSEEKAQAAKARIGKSLSRSVDKGRMTAEAAAQTLERITPAGSYDAFSDVDLALEAVAEDLEIKQQLFATFDKVCKPGAILATTTSSLPVVACARATSRPQDVIGMHFFNPAPHDEARRGRADRADRGRRARHRARGLREDPQAPGGLRGPGQASS